LLLLDTILETLCLLGQLKRKHLLFLSLSLSLGVSMFCVYKCEAQANDPLKDGS